MEDKIELWDLYDSCRQKTGRTIQRGSKFPQGYYHVIVHVCIFNEKGEMLIQKRARDKDYWSDKWDLSAGGAAISGESSCEAAERETFEELGLRIDLSQERPYITVYFDIGFDDYYLIPYFGEVNSKSKNREVIELIWADEQEIIDMINDNRFAHYHIGFIKTLFEMFKCRGTQNYSFDLTRNKNVHS